MRNTNHTGIKIGVAQTPLRFWMTTTALIVFFCLAAVISFYVGKYYSGQAAFQLDALRDENRSLLEALESEKIALASALVIVETSDLAVDRVREENVLLSKQVTELERDLTYYQRVMSPIHKDKGLRIDDVSLESTTDTLRKRLTIVLTQLGKKNKTIIQGNLSVIISGSELGSKKEYTLQSLSGSNQDIPLVFRFKYFQELSEEFLLPEGFVPESIRLSARSSGQKAMLIERTESWSFFTEAPESL